MRRLHREIIDYGLLKRRWTIGPIRIRQHRCLDPDCLEYSEDIGQPIEGRFVPFVSHHTLVLGVRIMKDTSVQGGEYEFLGYSVSHARMRAEDLQIKHLTDIEVYPERFKEYVVKDQIKTIF